MANLKWRSIKAIPCKGCDQPNYVVDGSRPDYHYACYLKHKRATPSRLGYQILDFLDGLEDPILIADIQKYLNRPKGSVHNACIKLIDLKLVKRTVEGCKITAKGECMLQDWRKGFS